MSKVKKSSPPAVTTGLQGKITGLYGNVLQGWVLDTDCPDVALAVEVYYDGVFGHLVRADEITIAPDIAQAAFHGFVVSLKQEWLSVTRCITARVANQGPWLEGTIELGKSKDIGVPAPPYGSNRLYYNDGLKLSGWVAPPAGQAAPLTVMVIEDGKVIASGIAHQRLAFLRNDPHQGYGFEIDLPWAFADGHRHTLEVTTEAGQPLAGSPITVCVTAGSYVTMVKDFLDTEHSFGHGQRPKSDQQQSAMLDVLTAHERLYPATLGWGHYAQWLALYQTPPPMRETQHVTQPTKQARCVVLVVGEKSEYVLIQRSLKSVEKQQFDKRCVECLVVRPSGLVEALRHIPEETALVVPLLAGDLLSPHALSMMVANLAMTDQPAWGYADSDELDASGARIHPCLKPDWDETLFLGTDLLTPGVHMSGGLIKQAFSLADAKAERLSSWNDFLVSMVATDRLPKHLVWVLYHQQASDGARKSLSHQNRLPALNWLAQRRVPGAQVNWEDKAAGRTRVVWPLPDTLPKVSVIVPTRDAVELLQTVMNGLMHTTSYPNVEWIVVDNESTHPDTLAYFKVLKKMGVRLLAYPKPFNYAAINNLAAKKATGELILFLNNDTEILDSAWLTEMVAQFQRPGVGIVGKKLLWPNRMVQHGGVVVGIHGLAAHSFVQCQSEDPGYQGFNLMDREQSAVTAACLLIRRADFLNMGGFDEVSFPVAFNDVDLCLKMRQSGQRVVITTGYPLIHNESASRGKEDSPQKRARARRERSHFIDRWMPTDRAFHDPFYHPGLNRDYHFGPYSGFGMRSFSSPPNTLSALPQDNDQPFFDVP